MEPKKWSPVVNRVLAGNICTEELPEIPQRLVRVYLSSTGSDSQTERNAFVERVYPKLREYCSQKYGVDFQVVDLDWGLSPQEIKSDISVQEYKTQELRRCHELSVGPSFVVDLDWGLSPQEIKSDISKQQYKTKELRRCHDLSVGPSFVVVDLDWGLSPQEIKSDISVQEYKTKELRRCHELSVGPSFVAFVGQKYGDCPLPPTIPGKEFENIRIALQGHKSRDTRAAPLLDKWYKKDDNSVPPVYHLQPIQMVLPDVTSSDEQQRTAAHEKWLEDESEMRRIFQKGAEISYLEGLIDGDTKQKYHMSCQDRYLQQGLEESGAPQNRCVLLMRSIVDLKNYVDDAKATEFAEISFNEKTERLEIDETCATKLSQMKTRAKGLTASNNSLEYEVLWRYDDVIHPKLHAPYLEKLCQEFHDVMRRLIDATVPMTSFDVEPDIYEEVLQHWVNAKRKSRFFYGQEEYVAKLKAYLAELTDKPLVLYGESGAGKSTLLSNIASQVCDNNNGRTICAVRYVGYTPKSSDIKQIVMTICTQITYTLGRQSNDMPYDFKELQRYFNELLESIPSDIKVVIFIDSLEKLIPEYNAHFMSWLPAKLKANIKIVVTVHDQKHGILERLKTEVLKDTSTMVELKPMSVEDAEGLMQYILEVNGRQLTSSQIKVFRESIKVCSLPMYVQLLSDIARKLKSFDTLRTSDIPKDVQEAINMFFDNLETKHGKTLVGRSLGYLVASVTGLSDCEMEDLLSLDDDVLNSVFIHYHPPVRRIPYIKWLSIKDDIEHFLDYREADGITVHFWCHQLFENVVKERYLKDETIVKEVHILLSDYFLGTWAGKPKPIKVSASENTDGLLLLPCGNEADRLVALQPLSFETPGEPVRYNKRKYDQVPRHLYLASRFKELNSLVLFSYNWLYNKIKALSLTHIMADFVLNPGEEATLVEEALRVAEPTIQNNINNLAPEISGHLLPYYKTHANIRALVQQCDTAGLKHSALIPNFPYLQVPGSSLQYTLDCPVAGEFFRFTNEDRYLLTKVKDSSVVHVFDVATGEVKGSVFASNGDLYVTPNGKYFVIVDHVTEKAIKIHRSDTGQYVGQLIVMNHIQLKLKEKYKMGSVCLTDERLAVIVTTETSFLCIADVEGCQFLQIIGLDGKSDICDVTPNGRFVFCNSNEFMLCYDLYSLEHICTVSASQRPSAIAFTKDGFRAFLANSKEPKLLVMHVHRGAVEMAYKTPLDEDMPDDKIVALKVSPKDDQVLIRGMNNILVYNRFTEKVTARFPRPPDVPKEFKLPKSYYTDIFYTNAEFSRDGKFVIATIFRNIYLWQVSSGNLITNIQAPVGIVSGLLISRTRSQIVTHVEGSTDVQVWNINKAVNQVNMLDKLTGVIEDIKLTNANTIAYVRCQSSDELGIIDMRNGVMLDLLTHTSPIHDFGCTPDGQYVMVSTKPKKKNQAFKIWNMDERKVVKEFGNTTGYCIGAHDNQSIILVAQEQNSYKAPYYITTFNFMSDGFRESTHPLSLKYILKRPFLTQDDQTVVVLTAQDYVESMGFYDTPTICAFSLDNDLKVSYYTPESFREAVDINTIEDLQACSNSANTIIVLYTTNAVIVDMNANKECKSLDQLGFLVLDINTGAIMTICEPFLKPGISMDSVVFSGTQFCIDDEYNIFDIIRGQYVAQLPNPGVPPRLVAMYGNALIYYKGSKIFVVSLRNGEIIANVEVHATISKVTLCSDQSTIMVGCMDGSIVSYVLIDPLIEDPESIISTMGSRNTDGIVENGRTSRCWDKVEDSTCPTYSRPPSALSLGPKERSLLKQVKHVPKIRPSSDTLLYLNEKSKTCNIQ